MKYISTRSATSPVTAREAVLNGLAPDGGLYLPETWPTLSSIELQSLKGRSFAAIAGRILAPFFLDEDLSDAELAKILDDCFGPTSSIFDTPQITPLVQIADHQYLLELFHGPTLAFKDIPLQFLARLIGHYTQNRATNLTFIGATSGDTGSAAIHACAHLKNARTFILHPAGKISEIQRRQMTTHVSSRVYNIALDGTFDDCQALVKTLLNDHDFTKQFNLIPVNSINWGRIAMQTVYYFAAALAFNETHSPPTFVVPTGNFGNVFAGYVARSMGLPMGQLVVASNHNDILYRFFKTGEMAIDRVVPSCSPSMDIQVSSNFERFLFDLVGRDSRAIAHLMEKFSNHGNFRVTAADHIKACAIFGTGRASDEQTIAMIKRVYNETKMVIDPHTAVGVHVAQDYMKNRGPSHEPIISLACAHPAKFPDTIKKAIGFAVPLPDPLKHMMQATERVTPIRNDLNIVKNYISGIVGA